MYQLLFPRRVNVGKRVHLNTQFAVRPPRFFRCSSRVDQQFDSHAAAKHPHSPSNGAKDAEKGASQCLSSAGMGLKAAFDLPPLPMNRMTERRLAAGLNRCLSTRRLRSESNRKGHRQRISRQHAGAPVPGVQSANPSGNSLPSPHSCLAGRGRDAGAPPWPTTEMQLPEMRR